jgi:hypothetical protein
MTTDTRSLPCGSGVSVGGFSALPLWIGDGQLKKLARDARVDTGRMRAACAADVGRLLFQKMLRERVEVSPRKEVFEGVVTTVALETA